MLRDRRNSAYELQSSEIRYLASKKRGNCNNSVLGNITFHYNELPSSQVITVDAFGESENDKYSSSSSSSSQSLLQCLAYLYNISKELAMSITLRFCVPRRHPITLPERSVTLSAAQHLRRVRWSEMFITTRGWSLYSKVDILSFKCRDHDVCACAIPLLWYSHGLGLHLHIQVMAVASSSKRTNSTTMKRTYAAPGLDHWLR